MSSHLPSSSVLSSSLDNVSSKLQNIPIFIMKIQKATSPPPDTPPKKAPTIRGVEDELWPDLKACPTSLNSVFALTQAGLSSATASAIHKAYNTIPHPCLCLKTYAINYIAPLARRIDAAFIEDDWISILIQMGANEQLVQAIVQPDMEDVMLSDTAWGWVQEAMNVRWEFYEGMIRLEHVKEVGGRGPGEQFEVENAA
jgi:hypothetical protein